jgi:hypothetical protein
MVKSITGREQRSQPAARPCCRLSDFRPPQLSYLPPPLTDPRDPRLGRKKIRAIRVWTTEDPRDPRLDHEDPRDPRLLNPSDDRRSVDLIRVIGVP